LLKKEMPYWQEKFWVDRGPSDVVGGTVTWKLIEVWLSGQAFAAIFEHSRQLAGPPLYPNQPGFYRDADRLLTQALYFETLAPISGKNPPLKRGSLPLKKPLIMASISTRRLFLFASSAGSRGGSGAWIAGGAKTSI